TRRLRDPRGRSASRRPGRAAAASRGTRPPGRRGALRREGHVAPLPPGGRGRADAPGGEMGRRPRPQREEDAAPLGGAGQPALGSRTPVWAAASTAAHRDRNGALAARPSLLCNGTSRRRNAHEHRRDIPLRRIDGSPTTLGEFRGKVLLIVNVASKCGLTPQYEALEKLYESRRDRGLVVLGFPANDFGAQEPGTNEEILAFCTST